jgi:hypothetical protein
MSYFSKMEESFALELSQRRDLDKPMLDHLNLIFRCALGLTQQH